ncbi:endonuclease/exonuclease/phosphatase family protein [Streptomyces sp. NPDC018352]|uniref:endonuclease/exonuclease/phosphatase family protein n=1 Tax=Streptomyces sp. NPDC018352 TaxID=3157194 RepID=UPI0033EE2731
MGSEYVPGEGRDVIRVVTYNLRGGGLDGDGVETGTGAIDISRWEQQIKLLLKPAVLCLQEGKYYDRNDFEMARRTGQALGMEWYLAPSDSHGSHLVTLVNPRRVEVRRFVPDAAEGKFHHTLVRADLVDQATGWNFTVLNTHLAPLSPANRAREVTWLTEYGARDDVILVGDLNSEAPGDPAVTSWSWLPEELHSRHRFQNPDAPTQDRTGAPCPLCSTRVSAALSHTLVSRRPGPSGTGPPVSGATSGPTTCCPRGAWRRS